MKTGAGILTTILLAAVIGGAGIYTAGTRAGPDTETDAAPALPVTQPGDGNSPASSKGDKPLDTIHTTDAMPAANRPPPQTGRAHLHSPADPDARFTHFRVGQRNVKQIMADGDLMWVGTSGGVIRYNIRTDEYRLFDLRSGLLANGIFHLSKFGDRLVVGTYGGGMSIYDAEHDGWDTYNIPEGLGDAFVYDVLQIPGGDIWIATWSGANRVRQGALDDRNQWDLFTVENTSGGLPNDWVYGLAAGKDGEVWMATEGGLARFLDGKWSNWNHKDGLGAPYEVVREQIQFSNDPARFSRHHARQKTEMDLENVDIAYNPNYIVALQVDREGVVWAGTWGGGLARFDGTRWRNYTVADGLPANHVFSLHEDPEGRLWVGTSKGLALMEDGGFRTFGTDDGLFSDIVFSMETATDGSTWIGSFGGVARIARLD